MSFINFQDLDSRVHHMFGSRTFSEHSRIEKAIKNEFLIESVNQIQNKYDIFLSHKFIDAVRIQALKDKIEEEYGFTVFVDWLAFPDLDRNNITKTTAKALKTAMSNCTTLILAYSEKSNESLWIPWETGYFDGSNGKVSIMPIFEEPTNDNLYVGQEYLNIYPYITEENDTNENIQLWVNDETPDNYIIYNAWLKNKKPFRR